MRTAEELQPIQQDDSNVVRSTQESMPLSARIFDAIKSRNPTWINVKFKAIILAYFFLYPIPFYRLYHRSRLIYATFSHMFCYILLIINIIIYASSDLPTELDIDIFYPLLSYIACTACTCAVFCYSEESHVNQLIVSKYPEIQSKVLPEKDNIIAMPDIERHRRQTIEKQGTIEEIEEVFEDALHAQGGNSFPTKVYYVKKWMLLSYIGAIPVAFATPFFRFILGENIFGTPDHGAKERTVVAIGCIVVFYTVGWIIFMVIECAEYYMLRLKMINNFTDLTKEHGHMRKGDTFKFNTVKGVQEWYITRLRIQLFRRKRSLAVEGLAGLGIVFVAGAIVFFLIKSIREDSIQILFESVLSLRIMVDLVALFIFFLSVCIVGSQITAAQLEHKAILMIYKTDAIADSLSGDQTADERAQMLDAIVSLLQEYEIMPVVLGLQLTPEFLRGLMATSAALLSAYLSQMLNL